MSLQGNLTHLAKADLGGSLCATCYSSRVGWPESRSRQWTRPPFLLVVLASSRNPGHPRSPIWRGRLLSNESLRAVQELKRANARKDHARLSFVLNSLFARLLQFDMLAVLTELQRQNECELALEVFDAVRKEFWYKPDERLFSEMIITFARNKRVDAVDKLYALANTDGLPPSIGFYTEVVNARVGFGELQKAMDVYDEMRKAGFAPCDPAYGVLRGALEKKGDLESAAALKKEYTAVYGEASQEGEPEKMANMAHV